MSASVKRRGRLEIIVPILIFIGTTWAIFSHLGRHAGNFYQPMFGPAISLACTGKFEDFTGSTEPFKIVNDFLALKSRDFNCADLPPTPMGRTPITEILPLQSQYLLFTAGAIWSVTGVSWAALNYLGAVLAGAFALSVYGLSRLLVPLPWAVAVTACAAMARLHLNIVPDIRDYSKAPFILGMIFFSALLLKGSPDTKRAVWLSIAAGVVSGVGFGFRTDLLLVLPFFLIVLTIFLIRSRFHKLFLTTLCAIAFFLCFALVSAPVLRSLQGGGTAGHVALLGLTTPFNQPLGVTDQIYDIGDQYSDQDIFSFVQQYVAMNFHGAGAPPKVYPLQPEYFRYSILSLLDFARNFPADIMTRALAAVAGVLHSQIDLVIFALAVALLLIKKPVLSVFFVAYVFYFGGSFALQFDRRHSFYLGFVRWLSAAIVADWICRLVVRNWTSVMSDPRPHEAASSAQFSSPRRGRWREHQPLSCRWPRYWE